MESKLSSLNLVLLEKNQKKQNIYFHAFNITWSGFLVSLHGIREYCSAYLESFKERNSRLCTFSCQTLRARKVQKV